VLTLVSVGYIKTTPVVVALAAVACGAQLAAAAAGRYAPYPGPRERPPGPVQAVVRTGAHAVRSRRRRRELARVTKPGS
jgi:hypothetical protein